jgi:hypothetical protein
LLHNPHGQRLLERLPAGQFINDHALWSPLDYVLRRLVDPQVTITLGLSIISFGIWQLLKREVTRRTLLVTAAAVSCYLLLSALVIASAIVYLARHPEIFQTWLDAIFAARQPADAATAPSEYAWLWVWLGAALWSFPQMALGLSGFEMILTVVPRVSGDGQKAGTPEGRVRNTRKLMLSAASIMAVYLLSAVVVTTLLVPRAELMPGGAAEHRALAYLAHGSPLTDIASGTTVSPLFGDHFGDLFDLSTAIILCLAGASVTMGLQNHPFQAVSVLGSMLAAVFPRVLNVGFPAIPGEPSRSTPKHAFSGRNSDSLNGMACRTCCRTT